MVLSSPDPARRQGQIGATCPAVNEAQFTASARGLMRKTERPSDAQMIRMVHPLTPAFLKRQDAFNKARMDILASMNAAAQSSTTRMATSTASSVNSGTARTLGSIKKTGTSPATHLQPQVIQATVDITRLTQAPQSLASVAPVSGKPGTKVMLAGTNLLPDYQRSRLSRP